MMDKLKLLIYEVLTQVIIILGHLREILKISNYLRVDRHICSRFLMPDGRGQDKSTRIICCDCRLTHEVYLSELYENLEFANPIRPKKYNYTLRYFEDKTSIINDYKEFEDKLVPKYTVRKEVADG
jgi:hypothetical protein